MSTNTFTPRQKINLTLDPRTIAKARAIGNGNVSRGIDKCVARFPQKLPTKEKP